MSRSMVRQLAAGIAALMLVAASISGFGMRGVSAQAGNAVEIKNFQYTPNNQTVPVGTTVTWTNNDQPPHTATARDGSFDTGTLTTGQSKAITLDKAGTFEYYCRIHPEMTSMITVAVAQQSPAASAAPSAAPSASPSAAPSAAPAASGPAPLVEASDQAIMANSVTVARVVAAQDGWIVIHVNTPDNKPGPVIGQTAVKTGENTNVKVMLSQMPNAGDKVWPMLHIDAGAIGTYEFPGADVPVQVNG